jgi:hypothetical protein
LARFEIRIRCLRFVDPARCSDVAKAMSGSSATAAPGMPDATAAAPSGTVGARFGQQARFADAGCTHDEQRRRRRRHAQWDGAHRGRRDRAGRRVQR